MWKKKPREGPKREDQGGREVGRFVMRMHPGFSTLFLQYEKNKGKYR